MRGRMPPATRGAKPRMPRCDGFTLLEIMVVLLLVAVMAAVVAPSVMRSLAPDARDEARRLAQALRLAADEAQLDGLAVRWLGWRDRWRFEKLDEAGEWRPVRDAPFAPHRLPEGLRLLRASGAPEASALEGLGAGGGSADKGGEQGPPPLAVVLLPPDGAPEPGWIELGRGGDAGSDAIRLEIAPGPGGIRLADAAGGAR